MIEWLTGPHDDWAGLAIAVGLAVVAAYAAASLAGRLARRVLAWFAATDGEGGSAVADALRARDGERPVRVIVCHWSRMRPVFSTNGNSSSVRLAGPRGGVATKCALPSE